MKLTKENTMHSYSLMLSSFLAAVDNNVIYTLKDYYDPDETETHTVGEWKEILQRYVWTLSEMSEEEFRTSWPNLPIVAEDEGKAADVLSLDVEKEKARLLAIVNADLDNEYVVKCHTLNDDYRNGWNFEEVKPGVHGFIVNGGYGCDFSIKSGHDWKRLLNDEKFSAKILLDIYYSPLEEGSVKTYYRGFYPVSECKEAALAFMGRIVGEAQAFGLNDEAVRIELQNCVDTFKKAGLAK